LKHCDGLTALMYLESLSTSAIDVYDAPTSSMRDIDDFD
jgi:hypothetical protein